MLLPYLLGNCQAQVGQLRRWARIGVSPLWPSRMHIGIELLPLRKVEVPHRNIGPSTNLEGFAEGKEQLLGIIDTNLVIETEVYSLQATVTRTGGAW